MKPTRLHASGFLTALALLAAVAAGGQSPPTEKPYTTWRDYGGSADSMQYSALTQINKTNVSQLELAWFYPVSDRTGTFGFNPIVIDGVMYVLGPRNGIVALDAATGAQIWAHGIEDASPGNRGINYWESKDRSDRRLVFGAGGYLYALDASDWTRDSHVRRERPRGHARWAASPAWWSERHGGSDLREPVHHRIDDRRGLRFDARRPPRLRHRHRQAGVDVPHDSASGRVRLRHLARGRLQVGRRRQRLGRDLDRREARHRLFPARVADPRFVWRRSQGRQPLCQLPARARRAHRQAAVALPDHPSRHLGLRPDDRAEAADGSTQRQEHRRGGASDEVRPALRLRSRHRTTASGRSRSGRSRSRMFPARRPGRRSRFQRTSRRLRD